MSDDSVHPEDVTTEPKSALGHLLYISEAVRAFTRAELNAIRETSARNNAKRGVSGVLFYSRGHFVQLLEGDMGVIDRLFEKVASDPRHQHVKLLVLRPAEQRIFSDWGMGLLDLDGYGEAEHRDLKELIKLAHEGDNNLYGTPVEMAILSRFCMLLPAG